MPHVVIKGPISVEDIWIAFQPTQFAEGDNHFKAEEAFLSTDKNDLLVRSLTVERGFTKRFFVRFTQREGAVAIALDKIAAPDRSDGVKRLLGLFAWKVLQAEPEATIEHTNIQEFIREPAR
jgi:hypothetical protein